MTDAERPFVNESVEAFRQARIRETRAAPKRDDGALVELARAIGEQRCVAPTSADPSEPGAVRPEKMGLVQQAVPAPAIAKETAASAPEVPSRRTDVPRFAPAYRKVSQTVKLDWELGRVAAAKTSHPTDRALDTARATDDLQRYRSLPGTPALHPKGFAQFAVGHRFNVKWPEQRAARRVNDHVKMAVSVGVIAAAIAGFWGGSVIRTGRGEANASLSEPKETSGIAPSRAIPVMPTDTAKTGSGSPFGSAPLAFPANDQGAMVRPMAPAIPVAKPDLKDGGAASPDTGQAYRSLNAEVPTSLPAPLTGAPDAAAKGFFDLQPVAALAASPSAPTSPLPTNSSTATNPAAATSSMPASSGPVTPDAAATSSASKGLNRAAQPVKKHMAIVRFNHKAIAADRPSLSLRPPASVPQPRPVVAQPSNDFFLTRFFDKMFRN